MLNTNDPLVQLKITSATCSVFALGSTVYRLYKRRGRFWADDLWAMFAMLALIAQVIAVFLHIPVPNHLSKTTGVAVYYLMATTFYAIIWASRLSILFSIVRIDPSAERRKALFWIAVAFVLICVFMIAQLFWVCEPHPAWKHSASPQCKLTLQVAVCQLVTDIMADTILLLAPVPLFRSLSDKGLRRKLTLIFSTCVVTTIVSLVHAAFILRNGGIKVVISALVEDCMSLIVANIPVVVTTLVDIVGDTAETRRTRTTPFSTMFWWSDPGTTRRGVLTEGAVATLNLLVLSTSEESPDDMELTYSKTTKSSANSWNRSDREHGVDDLSTKPVLDRRSYPYPTSPL
ncbi:hypothetical protein C8R45DRAFT_276752 [Mycena sanguinolenta]|nr:hypothetical protein C8R45DRAFT_276752 [Mycena sanguinolenta]